MTGTNARFDDAVAVILAHEGGYVDHPSDPGGETNFGISKRAYPDVDIKALTRDGAAAIYRRDYWARCRCDEMPYGVALCVFDAAVNSGRSRAAKWLQSALGTVDVDGKIGPKTLAAVAAADERTLVEGMIDERLRFLRGLSTWQTFGRGWTRRVDETRAHALGGA